MPITGWSNSASLSAMAVLTAQSCELPQPWFFNALSACSQLTGIFTGRWGWRTIALLSTTCILPLGRGMWKLKRCVCLLGLAVAFAFAICSLLCCYSVELLIHPYELGAVGQPERRHMDDKLEVALLVHSIHRAYHQGARHDVDGLHQVGLDVAWHARPVAGARARLDQVLAEVQHIGLVDQMADGGPHEPHLLRRVAEAVAVQLAEHVADQAPFPSNPQNVLLELQQPLDHLGWRIGLHYADAVARREEALGIEIVIPAQVQLQRRGEHDPLVVRCHVQNQHLILDVRPVVLERLLDR